jgi:hypothetical protein
VVVVVVVAAFQNFSYKHPRDLANVGSLYISNTGTLYTRGKRTVTPQLAASTAFLSIYSNAGLYHTVRYRENG